MNDLLNQFLLYLVMEKNYSPHTLRAYQNDIKEFLAFLKDLGKEEFSRREIRLFLQKKGQHCKKSTIGRKISALRSYYRFLISRLDGRENPFEAIQSPKKEKKIPFWLTEEEIVRLLEAPDIDTPLGLRDRAILETLYGCGLRASEVVGLDIKDVDICSQKLMVRGKGRKERVVPFASETAYWIEKYLEVRPESGSRALFLNNRKDRLTTRSIQRIIQKHAQKAGISSHVTPHTLRHSYATHLLHRGMGLREVQELLGHASIGATQIYTHVGGEELKKAYLEFHPRSKGEVEKTPNE